MDLLSSILADEELTSYLQYMVQAGYKLDSQIELDIHRYMIGLIERENLFNNLEAEMKFQREKANVTK